MLKIVGFQPGNTLIRNRNPNSKPDRNLKRNIKSRSLRFYFEIGTQVLTPWLRSGLWLGSQPS